MGNLLWTVFLWLCFCGIARKGRVCRHFLKCCSACFAHMRCHPAWSSSTKEQISNHSTPLPVVFPPEFSLATCRHASGRGCPLRRWGTQGQIPGTALHLLPFGPPCHGRPSSRTACPAVRTSGQVGPVCNGRSFSTSPGTYCHRQTSPESVG